MSNSKFQYSDLKVSKQTFDNLIQFRTEILLDVNDLILEDDERIVKESLVLINESELYYILEYHQQIVINFLYFNEKDILENYLFWLYRVYYTRQLDLDFLLVVYEYWKKGFKRYLNKVNCYELDQMYDFLISNHKDIKQLALKDIDIYLDDEVETLYNLLINGKEEEVKTLIETNSNSIDDFIDFFSNKLVKALQKVGYMWEVSKLSVAKEHISSAIIEKLCLKQLEKFIQEDSKSQMVLLSNAPNEFHSMGLKILAKILEKKGYKVLTMKNSKTLKEDIVRAVYDFDISYLMFGISLSINLYNMAMIIDYIKKERKTKGFHIIIGGNACEALTKPKELLKADAYLKDIKSIIDYF